MTDKTGLRSISTFRPVIGLHPRPRVTRVSAVVARLSRHRNERFRASISAHSGLGAHVRRRARLAGMSPHPDHARNGDAYRGLPLILRRFVRRTRHQASNRGPMWPVTRPQLDGKPVAGGEIVPLDEPAFAIEPEPGFAEDDLREPLFFEEIPCEEPRRAEASTHPAMDAVVRRHTGLLRGDAPTSGILDAPTDHDAFPRAGVPSPLVAARHRIDERPGDRVPDAYAYADSPRLTLLGRRGRGVEQQAMRRPIPIMDAALFAELTRSEPPATVGTGEAGRSASLPHARAGRRDGLATGRTISSSATHPQRSPLLSVSGQQPVRPAEEPRDLSPWSQSAVTLRLRRSMAGGAYQTRNFGQSTQDTGTASLAFPIARDAFARARSQALPLRAPETIWRDASASGDDAAAVSPGIRLRATPLATSAATGGETFGPQPPMRRPFAMAAAALAAQAMSDAEESSHRSLDVVARWAPFLPTHAPLRVRIREPYPPRSDTAAASSSAMVGRIVDPSTSRQTISGQEPATYGPALEFDSGNRSTAHAGPGADLGHAVYPSATSGLSFGDQFGGDLTDLDRADRVVATRQFAQQPSEARFVSAFPRPDVVWTRALRLSADRPLAQRLAAHDEPFAPATRLMRAAAVAHVLRRLPPTVMAPALSARLAEQRQPSWPQRTVGQLATPEPGPATLLGELIQSLSSPSVLRAAGMMTNELADRAIFDSSLASTDAHEVAIRQPMTVTEPVRNRSEKPWIAAPLRLRRMPGELAQRAEQPAAGWAGAMPVPSMMNDAGFRQRIAQLPPMLRDRPDEVARKLAGFLGTSSPTTEQVAVRSTIRRIQPIRATFAAGFSASSLPAPARRQPSPATSAAHNALVEQSIAPWIPDQHPEAMALSPFVARRVARAELDLRLASPMPFSLPTARIQPTVEHGDGSPAALSPGRALPRSGEVYRSSAAALRGEAARPVVRPRRVAPGTPAASNDVNAGVVSSPVRYSPPTGQDAIDPISRFHGPLPFAKDFPGLPFVFTGTGRRQANPRSLHNRPVMASSRPVEGVFSPGQQEDVRRSAVGSILRWQPIMPSFAMLRQAMGVDASPAYPAPQGAHPATVPPGLAGSPDAPVRFDLPRFMRHAVTPAAATGGGLVSRPLVFRSALPSAGEPSLAQRTEAAEAMAQSSGQPLPPLVRRSMEHLFRMDLAPVRVHSGPQAARATDLVAARAMASGADVFLPGGVSDSPHSADLPLLAHELTHVAHHFGRRPPSAPTAAPLTLAHRAASTEQDAERVERTVAETIRRQPVVTSTPPTALTLARKPAPVTIMRVDDASPASSPSPASTPGGATSAATAGEAVNPASKQDQQKLADQIFHMLEQRLIVARERGGHRL